jgi:predicted transposase YdaD
VVRLWKEPVERFLTGSVPMVPLAPLAQVEPERLPSIVRRMARRINREPPDRAARLWTASFLLMGLRYPPELAERLLSGVMNMRESSTYQAILKEGLEEGRAKGIEEGRVQGIEEGLARGMDRGRTLGARQVLLAFGRKKFGRDPDAASATILERIDNPDQLDALVGRLLDPTVTSWAALLKPARSKRRS